MHSFYLRTHPLNKQLPDVACRRLTSGLMTRAQSLGQDLQTYPVALADYLQATSW